MLEIKDRIEEGSPLPYFSLRQRAGRKKLLEGGMDGGIEGRSDEGRKRGRQGGNYLTMSLLMRQIDR